MTEALPLSALAGAALAYAQRGIPVFPVHGVTPAGCTCGRSASWHLEKKRKPGKHPVPHDGLKAATIDAQAVRLWWWENRSYNIGLTPGPTSGFWVLDIDGPEGAAALAALEMLNGALPATPEQTTGKGRHLLFAWPAAGSREIRNSAGKIGCGIDVRGAGGYIVAAPSMHENGRAYAWAEGRGLLDLAFAPAPAWLFDLAAPLVAAPRPAAPARVRVVDGSSATPYGEAAINNQCRRVVQAPPGRRNDTLNLAAFALGQLHAGGEIHDEGYALRALRSAGEDMCAASGEHWTKREEDTIDRGWRAGQLEPQSAPNRHERRAAQPDRMPARAAPTPADAALSVMDARGLWDSARPAGCWPVLDWLNARGLAPNGIPGALEQLRAHGRAPLPGGPGPALLVPLRAGSGVGEDAAVNAVALLALDGQSERFCRLVGDSKTRACLLAPPTDGLLLVTIDLQDAWRLGTAAWAQSAREGGDRAGVAIAPTFKAFAGGMLGDRFGRVSVETPMADPAARPWTMAEVKTVIAALRLDFHTPELRVRKAAGGTHRVTLDGEAAARFYGGLIEQAWKAAHPEMGANAVRLLLPRTGMAGFSLRVGGVA
jgi:hypothetical protein